ncbi:MAG: hypothetical protein H6607_07740 [Flavobacteriales bacterium]|nr:hypothetical protein [Flavobacteriales bacterium]
MNFLSHYYFDHQKGNPHFNLGLILPDLVRNFVKGSKLNFGINQPEDEPQLQLFKGCIKHVASDKIFHAWGGFHHLMEIITYQIRNSSEDIDKDWFVAHILAELTIDYYLIKRHPQLANNLYNDFELVDTQALHSYLQKSGFNTFEKFDAGFDRFMEMRYLESYQKKDNIVFALGKICTKMGLKSFTNEQKSLISDIIELLSDEMPQTVVKLEFELKE